MPIVEKEVHRTTHNSAWRIVTFKKPVLWNRTNIETWYFLPKRRYILNANQLSHVETHIETISDLATSRHFNPLRAGQPLLNSRILVERYRDRGFGDMLFMTGPLSYLRHVSGNTAEISLFALADRGELLEYHPALAFDTPLLGPALYDELPNYHYHWFVDTVTEFDEEPDQLNVYDALYKSMGIDPGTVDYRFKRPSINLVEKDWANLDQLYYFIFATKRIDLRQVPYYVVAPHANGNIRLADFSLWLTVIQKLAQARPVVVTGFVPETRVPSTDISYGTFVHRLDQMAEKLPVLNLLGQTPMRVTAALVKHSVCMITLDTGFLYVAQALRVPCVSLWGPYAPSCRIHYDQEYMDLAIWNKDACSHSPCYAYAKFPTHKCPSGTAVQVCDVLRSIRPEQVIDKVTFVENKYRQMSLPPGQEKVDPVAVGAPAAPQ